MYILGKTTNKNYGFAVDMEYLYEKINVVEINQSMSESK